MLNEGYILENRYKILSVAGKGGTSVVYRAADIRANNAQRAVKEVLKDNGVDANNAMQEAEFIRVLYEKDVENSFFPNIIDIIRTPRAVYIVQDFINGKAMDKVITESGLNEKAVLSYAKEICRFMSFIHKHNLIHSDMKPDNIMVVGNDNDIANKKTNNKFGKLKFIDFGSLIALKDGVFAFTPAYAAPEQLNEETLDERTDIFNMGATFYHMLTGKKPMTVSVNGKFMSSHERFVFDKKYNADLVRIIQKCVNDDRNKRYRNCEELYDDLYKAENHTSVKVTGIVAALSAVFLLFSLFSGAMASKGKSETFNELVERAENASQYDEKSEALIDVINADGSYAPAYISLIELYKNDMIFSNEENEQILKLLNENTNAISNNPHYAEVAYELGILYWYYYYYGSEIENAAEQDSSISGKIQSKKWFENAQTDYFQAQESNKYEIARIYYTIGDFFEKMTRKEPYEFTNEYMLDIWTQMNELNELVVEANAGSEIIILETYKTLINLENINMQRFSIADISYDEQKAFIDDIRKKTDDIRAVQGSAAELKEYILTYYEKVAESIEGSK